MVDATRRIFSAELSVTLNPVIEDRSIPSLPLASLEELKVFETWLAEAENLALMVTISCFIQSVIDENKFWILAVINLWYQLVNKILRVLAF